ncbi:hypothetical protein, partial [Acinetobacter baumannii]|uniref:hypothetical protein n=1 Tax=Acinetobacter baumannii TaxID=470 RepID=UPI003398471D
PQPKYTDPYPISLMTPHKTKLSSFSLLPLSQVEEHHRIQGQDGFRASKCKVSLSNFINQQGMGFLSPLGSLFPKGSFKLRFQKYEIQVGFLPLRN